MHIFYKCYIIWTFWEKTAGGTQSTVQYGLSCMCWYSIQVVCMALWDAYFMQHALAAAHQIKCSMTWCFPPTLRCSHRTLKAVCSSEQDITQSQYLHEYVWQWMTLCKQYSV